MSDFHFIRPWWLLGLIPLMGLVVLLYRQSSSGGDWKKYCDAELLPAILGSSQTESSLLPAMLTALTGTLTLLALAGPAWERLPAPAFRSLSALVIVLDLSPAMDAADIKPNRLDRARFKINDILRARKDGQAALVVYAGDSFTVTPLTDDSATITSQLTALSPKIMPVTGARPDLGLERAARLLDQAGIRAGDVLLVTAGENADSAEKAARKLFERGYRVSVLGVGTVEGGPIPSGSKGFLKDERGAILIPRLNPAVLTALARSSGGTYRTLQDSSSDVSDLVGFFDRRNKDSEASGNTLKLEQWKEGGIYLLPLLLPLSALAFRRGWLGMLLIGILAPVPQPASAFAFQDLWLTPDQQAARELESGKADAAAQQFKNPAWKAAAEYKANQLKEAIRDLKNLDTTDSHYNRGNALARQGQYEEALKAYDRALQLNPANEDAAYNRKLVEEAKRQQEQKKQDQNKKDKGQDEGQQPEQSKSGEQEKGQKDQKDGSEQQNQQGDRQKQDQENQDGEQEKQDQKDQQGQQQQGDQQQPQNGQESPEGEQNADQDLQPGSQESGSNKENQEPGPSEQPGEDKNSQKKQQDQTIRDEAEEDDGEKTKEAGQAGEKADEPTGDQKQPVLPSNNKEIFKSREQWLKRIPDDPGGLLKRKFYYQYRQRQQQESERSPW